MNMQLENEFRLYTNIVEVDEYTSDILKKIQADLYPSNAKSPLTYKDIMSIAIAVAPHTEFDLWSSIMHTMPYRPQDNYMLDNLVNCVFNYYRDYRVPELCFHKPTANEINCLNFLIDKVCELSTMCDGDKHDWITNAVYDCGKKFFWSNELRIEIENIPELVIDGLTIEEQIKHKKEHQQKYGSIQKKGQELLRDFFAMVYSVILGQTDGPRLPVYILMLGSDKFIDLVKNKINTSHT